MKRSKHLSRLTVQIGLIEKKWQRFFLRLTIRRLTFCVVQVNLNKGF
jgi:hypothetical protein